MNVFIQAQCTFLVLFPNSSIFKTVIFSLFSSCRPGQSSHIKSVYRTEIARTLEPWISGSQHPPPSSVLGATNATSSSSYPPPATPGTSSQIPKDYTHPSISHHHDPSFNEPTYSQYYPMSRSTVTPIMGHKTPVGGGASSAAGAGGGYAAPAGIGVQPSAGRKTPTSGLGKGAKGDGMDDNFTAHCRSFTAHFNVSHASLHLSYFHFHTAYCGVISTMCEA